MSKYKIAIICEANPATNPRPNRVIKAFKDEYEVTAIGRNATEIDGVRVLSYEVPKKRNFLQEILLHINVFMRNYRTLIFIPTRLKIAGYLQEYEFDFIFCHDLVLLPIVLENKKNAKVIMDLREYYPRECEENRRWRRLFAKFNDWMCREFLKQADYIYTIAPGIAREYEKNYNIKCNVIMSLPDMHDIFPDSPTTSIRLIHHGLASPDRRIEGMIEMMDYVDSRFSLDLMLVKAPAHSEYYAHLEKMANTRSNVRIIPPVPFEEIIPFISQYDMGIFLCPPTTFNLLHCLPNKFFEFIQAHLAIIIGPSPEMAEIVEREGLGIIAQSFAPQAVGERLLNMTRDELTSYKRASKSAAQLYNSNQNKKVLKEVIAKMCS